MNRIKELYSMLKKEDRIFVPAHVIREFLDNRPTKLAELYESLHKRISQNFSFVESLPLLEELAEFKDLNEQEKLLKENLKKYRSEINRVLSVVNNWSWNDPVTNMYQEVLHDRILTDNVDYEALKIDLENRIKLKIPPGYKDGNKDSNNAGDLIIWNEICQLGQSSKKDIIFISGDDKPDWWHKSSKEALYPRFELVDEFRRKSGGYSFHMMSLSKFLELFDTSDEVVQEIKREEKTQTNQYNISANDLIQLVKHETLIFLKVIYNELIAVDEENAKLVDGKSGKQLSLEEVNNLNDKLNIANSKYVAYFNSIHRKQVLHFRKQLVSFLQVDYLVKSSINNKSYNNINSIRDIENILEDLRGLLDNLPDS